MTDITISPEALEAVARVLHDHAEIFDNLSWDDLSEDDQESYIDEARSVCRAMLKAWPDSILMPAELILPLPKENSN